MPNDSDSDPTEGTETELSDRPTDEDEGGFVDPARPSVDDSDTDGEQGSTDEADQRPDKTPYGPEDSSNSEERPVPWTHDDEDDDDDGSSQMQEAMDDLKELGIAEDADEEEFIDNVTTVPDADGEDDPDFVEEWRDRIEDADGGDDDSGSDSSTSSDTGSSDDDDDESEGPYEFDEEPVSSDEIGLVDNDLDLSGLQDQQEVTLPTRGYDITYRDPKDDDEVTNKLRGEDAPDDVASQRKVAAQLAVKAIDGHENPIEGSGQCLTDELWASFSPPVRIEIGIKSMAMMGFLASLDGLGDGRARQRDSKSAV